MQIYTPLEVPEWHQIPKVKEAMTCGLTLCLVWSKDDSLPFEGHGMPINYSSEPTSSYPHVWVLHFNQMSGSTARLLGVLHLTRLISEQIPTAESSLMKG